MDFTEFDDVNYEALSSEVNSISQTNTNTYEELPDGDYEVTLKRIELKINSKGYPMLSVGFEALSGGDFGDRYKGRWIWINQTLIMRDDNDKFRIHRANEILKALAQDLDINVKFTNLREYNDIVNSIGDHCINSDYAVYRETNAKGFTTTEITGKFD